MKPSGTTESPGTPSPQLDTRAQPQGEGAVRAAARPGSALFPSDPTHSEKAYLGVRDPSAPLSGWRTFSRGQLESLVELAIAALPPTDDRRPLSTTVDDPLTVIVGVMVAARTERAWVALNLRWPTEWLHERMSHVGPMCLLHPGETPDLWRWECAVAARGSSHNAQTASLDAPPRAATTAADEHDATVPLSGLGACWVLFTSGTTGTPGAVVLTVDALVASADLVANALHVSQDDVWYACMPLFHVGGLSIVLRTWRCGARLISERRFDERLFVDAMQHHSCTLVSLVPTMLDRLVSAHVPAPRSLRISFIGGGPATAPLLQRATVAGWHPRFSYGLTEAASTVAVMRREPLPLEPAWVGLALPGNHLTLRAMGPDGVGEIVVHGPTLLTGHVLPGGQVRLRCEGPLATGDFGLLSPDGLLRVVDRRCDLIVSGGENVYPSEVEQVLLEHPGVVDACVIGLPDERWGQRVVAVVVLREGTSPQDVAQWTKGHLAAFAQPKAVYQVAALPRNAMGKMERRRVREQLQATVPT